MSSDKSDEFSLDGLEDLGVDENAELEGTPALEDDGFELDLSVDSEDFSLSEEDENVESAAVQDPNEFSLTSVSMNFSLDEEGGETENQDTFPSDELDLGDELKEAFSGSESETETESDDVLQDSNDDLFALDASTPEEAEFSDPLRDYSSPKIELGSEDLTEDVKAKLKEIDAIMEEDATNASFKYEANENEEESEDDLPNDSFDLESLDELSEENIDFNDLSSNEEEIESELLTASSLEESIDEATPLEEDIIFSSSEELTSDESLVGDLNLSDLNLEENEEHVEEEPVVPKKRKKKEAKTSLDEISEAYTGEMERTQATIANLRADRDELLKRIEVLEEDKLLSHRNNLTLRAELDEKKIELTIIRKKLNEEVNELKDRIRIFEERVLILEEKNKQLHQELDTAGQKNKIDVKRVMLRERELEQKLELLKADAETQIRNRDLKILELKRKIDGMEFDMESISQQEKKTLESRFELEDKLDKAIRTLRTAISTLEDDGNRSSTLEAIKKNIEM